VGKSEKVECAFTFTGSLLPVGSTELDQLRLRWMDRQSEAVEPLRQHFHHPAGIVFQLEPDDKSSSPGESHPQALTEPDVNLSAHPALIVQPRGEFHEPIAQKAAVPAEPPGPASEPPVADGFEVV